MEEGSSSTSFAIEKNIEALRSGRPYTHQQEVRTEYHRMEEQFFFHKDRTKGYKILRRRRGEDEAEYKMRNLLHKEKLSFWGQSEPSPELQHKYSYVRHHMDGRGENPRFVYSRVLNLEYMKRKIQIRKLLNLNYMAHLARGKELIGRTSCDWFRKLEKMKEDAGTPTLKQKFPLSQPPPFAVPREGQLEEMSGLPFKNDQYQTEEEFIEERKKLYPDAMTFSHPTDMKNPLNTKKGVVAPFESPYEAAHKKNRCRQLTMTTFKKLNPKQAKLISARRINAWRAHEIELPPEKVLKKKIKKVAFSSEVYEVLANCRLAEYDPKRRSDNKVIMYKVSCVTLRRAIFTHDWALVSKACELMSDYVRAAPCYESSVSKWSVWNGGLLALVNIYKDDLSILPNFAKMVRDVMTSHPSRVGIELATWFTQKGYFTEGINFLHEIEEQLNRTYHTWQRENFVKDNPRLSAITFVSELFTAVKEYSIYKHKCRLFTANSYDGDSTDLYEQGKFVLNLFQMLELRGDVIENDSTIIIEPMIDLTLSLFGKEAAKDTFLGICYKNEHNGVLADLFLQFLLQYFPNDLEEIEKQKAKLAQYVFAVCPLRRDVREKQYRQLIKKLPAVSKFKQLPKPAFSW